MKDKQKKLWARNSIVGLALGAGLFFGGLFISIWTWGFGAALGIPMMIFGLIAPFWLSSKSKEQKTWADTKPSESPVR